MRPRGAAAAVGGPAMGGMTRPVHAAESARDGRRRDAGMNRPSPGGMTRPASRMNRPNLGGNMGGINGPIRAAILARPSTLPGQGNRPGRAGSAAATGPGLAASALAGSAVAIGPVGGGNRPRWHRRRQGRPGSWRQAAARRESAVATGPASAVLARDRRRQSARLVPGDIGGGNRPGIGGPGREAAAIAQAARAASAAAIGPASAAIGPGSAAAAIDPVADPATARDWPGGNRPGGGGGGEQWPGGGNRPGWAGTAIGQAAAEAGSSGPAVETGRAGREIGRVAMAASRRQPPRLGRESARQSARKQYRHR